MAAFDKWHLFITGVELARLHRVKLIIVFIHSVKSRVYRLIEQYNIEGIVEIRPSNRV